MTPLDDLMETAQRHMQSGRLAEAEQTCRRAVDAHPKAALPWLFLGIVQAAQGKLGEAESSFRNAVELDSSSIEARLGLARALGEQRKLDEATACLRKAIEIQPSRGDVHLQLGNVLKSQGKLDEAIHSYRDAIRLKPNLVAAHINLGNAKRIRGQLHDAIGCYHEALRLQPDNAEARNSLGVAQKDLGHFVEAEESYREAMRLDHRNMAVSNLAYLLKQQGRLAEAEVYFRQALAVQPTNRMRATLATMLPPIYRSHDEMLDWRRRLIDNVEQLERDGVRLDLAHELMPNAFFLAYQGFNERDLQQRIARLCVPEENTGAEQPPRSPGSRLRIGFVSANLRHHTIGRLMRGVIAQLAERFSVSVFLIGGHDDDTTQFLADRVDHFIRLPASIPIARQTIAEQRLHALFYTDIGMDETTYALAFSRLAPVQCVTWGHPLTTGIPTVDYFISSEHLDTADAAEHYTETLVRLKNPAIYFYRPRQPEPVKTRAAFGLPDGDRLYGCPQSLFKLHPEFDEILAEILRRDPRGLLLLIRGRYPQWDSMILERFSQTMPDVVDRVRFLPQQSPDDFLSLNVVCDCMLDPIHFGGGNTSYEAFAVGAPIVTLPSEFLRSRITYALYQKMGVLDCVARDPADYVEIALRLANDPDYNREVRAKILAACPALYEDAEAARELGDFLEDAIAAATN